MPKTSDSVIDQRPLANAIRALSMEAVQKANSGHPGMPMGMADAATVLFSKFLKYDPNWPGWPDRDRFILSAGHGSMLLYSLLYLTGYARPTVARDTSNWTVTGDTVTNDNLIQFGEATAATPETITDLSMGFATGSVMQLWGQVASDLIVNVGVNPQLVAGALDITADCLWCIGA